jgi:hypothetical protein
VIVRVVGQGQYEVDDGLMQRLDELDRQAMEALERNDEESLDRSLDEMSELVRSDGLSSSDIVIPPSDLTLEETRKLVSETGFLPDPPARM